MHTRVTIRSVRLDEAPLDDQLVAFEQIIGLNPGWRAEIDGRPTGMHCVDGLFQAVSVPAGSNHITFSSVLPGMNWALHGLVAGVARMLVPTARSPSSYGVRR